jgi:phosphomethylpyrimidine synthase
MTQMKLAKKRKITQEMEAVARAEGIEAERIRRGVANGRIVIPKNVNREEISPVGIGEGLRVKVNANIGTSSDFASISDEIEKAEAAVKYGADAIMDLSTGGDLEKIRHEIMKVPVPLGTVPIYEAGTKAIKKRGSIVDMSDDDLFNVIEKQAKEGVDFMTLHAGLNTESLEVVLKEGRTTGIVSRGGSFLAAWMIHNKKENPLYSDYDYLLELAKEYDVTLSLGDALRPGCIKDATDNAQIKELLILGELTKRARDAGVQCMVEGPGHVPLNEIEANIKMQKKICDGAPFYVLGPLVTDIACGYDHITGAIGGAVAGFAGADFLCYVTPSEHLALPDVQDVRDGVIAFKIAAHAADIARGVDRERDFEMSKARFGLDWERQLEFCIDPERAKACRGERVPHDSEVCSMCGEFCAMKIVKEYLK